MARRAILVIFCAVFLSGCSLAFSAKRCADGPEDAVVGLFGALQSTDDISTDIDKPLTNIREVLDLRKIMRVVPDPRKLLATLGNGNPGKGWEELRFLRSLNVFHNTSGFEFQEYKITVARKTELLPVEIGTVRYQMVLKRVDILLDMTDDKNFKEVRQTYSRTSTATFSRGSYCITGLVPIDEWMAYQETQTGE